MADLEQAKKCYICGREIEETESVWNSYADKLTCKKCFHEITITWDGKKLEYIKMPEEMRLFLEDIESVCKKHNLIISHEDTHGSFEIQLYNDETMEWLKRACKDY